MAGLRKRCRLRTTGLEHIGVRDEAAATGPAPAGVPELRGDGAQAPSLVQNLSPVDSHLQMNE